MTGHEEQDLRAGGARGAGGLTELLQTGHDVQCPPLVNQAGIERWEQVGHQQHPRRRPPPGLQVPPLCYCFFGSSQSVLFNVDTVNVPLAQTGAELFLYSQFLCKLYYVSFCILHSLKSV